MTDIDYNRFYALLADEVRAVTDFTQSMQRLLAWGSESIPHDAWTALKALDCSAEPGRVGKWLARVLKRSPCPFPVRGIYFGLGECTTRAGVEYADIYFALMGEYQSSDKKLSWLWRDPRHYPDNACFRSKPLKAAGIICNEDEESGLGTPGHILFSIGFAALLLASSLNGNIYRLLGGTEPIGIVTGFDSGDLFHLGALQGDGFKATDGQMT